MRAPGRQQPWRHAALPGRQRLPPRAHAVPRAVLVALAAARRDAAAARRDAPRRGAAPPAHVARGDARLAVAGRVGAEPAHGGARGGARVEAEGRPLEEVLGPAACVLREHPAQVRRHLGRRRAARAREARADPRSLARAAPPQHPRPQRAEACELGAQRGAALLARPLGGHVAPQRAVEVRVQQCVQPVGAHLDRGMSQTRHAGLQPGYTGLQPRYTRVAAVCRAGWRAPRCPARAATATAPRARAAPPPPASPSRCAAGPSLRRARRGW
eukprot:scaffold40131_cov74-Phaeocystis_antarctica.AAC.1